MTLLPNIYPTHGGFNDISDRNMTLQKIAEGIMDIDRLYWQFAFWEISLPSLGNVNNYLGHILKNMRTWIKTTELEGQGEKMLHNATK